MREFHLAGAGAGAPVEAVLGEDARLQERADQRQDTLIDDPMTHALHQRGVVDLVEARLDVTFEHPLVGAVARREVVNLGDRVLGSSSWPEPVGIGLGVSDGLCKSC